MDVFEQALKAGVDIFIGKRGCRGACYLEPIVEVIIDGQKPVVYANIDEDKARRILEEHVKKGKVVEELVVNRKS
jgi:(2Fe-2S) ferredoxin